MVTSLQRKVHSSVWEGPLPSSCWQQRQHHKLPLCKASSPHWDMGRGQGFFFIKVFKSWLQGSPPSTEHVERNSRAVPRLLELYSQQRVWDLYCD
ncbi:hypothetical protein PoB_007649500 [Plakobranchus ocellatus]|uniref:Uncharacterized protein n=1 Tax=Plakobranchus ocellatus TaxID=259542 RepID=A0AAV4E0S0_9GAST|nr:hypothetical protein PoB_007649500 [Plakobranchus ocellatus]